MVAILEKGGHNTDFHPMVDFLEASPLRVKTQEVEINRLKERVKQLEVREGVDATNSRDDAPIKGRSIDEGEAATERVTTVLASGVVDVPTGSGSIPTASTLAEGSVPTGSKEVPTASPVFATATVVTPITRRKGKEVMVESETPKKQKVQEQIDAQVKDFKGMTFKEMEAKFNSVCKQMEDFIPIGSKEEAERIKRKGINLEQESAKKQKSSEEITEEAKSPEEVTEEKVHSEGQRSYWKITRLGGSSTYYQFFIDLLKHLDREDLNQLWRLVKETLSNRPPSSDKEIELWVELNRMYEPNKEDQLWTHTHNFMHALVEWKLYDSCGVLVMTHGSYRMTHGWLIRRWKKVGRVRVRKTKVVTRWGGGCFMAKGFYLVTKMGNEAACGDVMKVGE
nr:hypothetical protein [Tanacetum cinerariifolium]